MKYKVFISSFLKFAAAAGLRRWLRFFVFALLFGGCTVQFQLPPATVTNLPDGGKVDVLPDSIPAMYSTRPRFYWEQIEKSDSTYSFAVTDANQNGRWLDSMRWIPAGPFVTVGADTLATLGAVRDTAAAIRGDIPTLDGNGIFTPSNSGDTIASGMLVNLQDSLVFRDSRGIDSPNFMLNLERAGVFPAGDHEFIRLSADYNDIQLSGLESLSRLLEYEDSGFRRFELYDLAGSILFARYNDAGTSATSSIGLLPDSTIRLSTFGINLAEEALLIGDYDTVLVIGPSNYTNNKKIYKKAISDFTVGGDNWGSQVVVSDSTLTGDGTSGSPLSVVAGGGGSMSSFLLDADTGTPETINDGDTITVGGGFGINTSVGATDKVTVKVDTSQIATISALQDTAAAIRGDFPALDGNGIFDAANDGGTIPTNFDAQITDEFTLTDGTDDLFSINSVNGHTAIGKGANESSQYSLNITEVMNYNSGSFGGLLITNSYNHNANSSGGLVGLLANPTVSGTHVPSYVYGASISPSVSGSANLTTIQGIRARPIHSGSATITTMTAVHAQLFETGSGDVTIGYGLNVDNNSGTFNTVHGVRVNDQTATANVYGVSSGISSGTGKYNIYASGTAANYFNGDTQFGNAIKDKDGDTGTAGQLLSSTGSQTDWVDPPAAPQYAMSYILGGANSSIAAGTPEQFNGTTTGTVDTVAATSNFTVQSDGEIEWNGANNSVLEITADFSFYMSTSTAIIYFYIAKNGVVEPTSRITQRSSQTFREGGTINWIDTDADSGDVYGVYVDFYIGTLGITSEDIRIKIKQIE